MTFSSKGWIPDHCLSKLSASLTDVLTVKFRVSPTCSAHTQGTKTRQEREEGTTSACKNHRCSWENENTPLRRSNAPTERTCLLSIQNLCTAEQVHRETLCHHKDVWRPLVHVRCHCTDAIKNFPHAFAGCVFELTSHFAGHVTTWYLVECGSVRNDN